MSVVEENTPVKSKLNKKIIVNNIKKYFLSDEKKGDNLEDLFEEVAPKGKLKKVSLLIQQREERRRDKLNKRDKARLFLDEEAQLGSDNEEHDDHIRQDNDSEDEIDREYRLKEELDEVDNLEGLIDDNYEHIDPSQREKEEKRIRNKYLEDEMELDRKQIKRVINFDHNKVKNKYKDMSDGEEYIPIEERYRISKGKEDRDSLCFQTDILNYLKKKRRGEEEKYLSSENEEMKELEVMRREAAVKKHAQENNVLEREFVKIIKDGRELIKRSSINLNEVEKEEEENNSRQLEYHSIKKNNSNLVYNCGTFYSKRNSIIANRLMTTSGNLFHNTQYNKKPIVVENMTNCSNIYKRDK